MVVFIFTPFQGELEFTALWTPEWGRDTGRCQIGKGFARLGNKLPVVTLGAKHELQNSEGFRVADFAVWFCGTERTMVLASGADDKFADAVESIGLCIGILRREAFVIVIVAIQHHGGVRTVEIFQNGLISGSLPCLAPELKSGLCQ